MGVLDSFRLNGRVSAVTGANRGIGRALAVALAEAGSDLALVVRDPSSCAGLIEQVAALGVRAEAVAADVTDVDAVTRAVDTIAASHGRIDVLVNNAGDCIHRPALEVTPQEWAHVIDTNVTGVWNCSQAFGRYMTEHGGGSIVNIGSISAPDRQPPAEAARVQHLEGGGAPADQVAGGGVGARRGPGQRRGPGLRQDRDGPGGRAAVPPALDRGRPDAALRRSRGARAAPSSTWPATRPSFMTGSVLVIDGGYTVF